MARKRDPLKGLHAEAIKLLSGKSEPSIWALKPGEAVVKVNGHHYRDKLTNLDTLSIGTTLSKQGSKRRSSKGRIWTMPNGYARYRRTFGTWDRPGVEVVCYRNEKS